MININNKKIDTNRDIEKIQVKYSTTHIIPCTLVSAVLTTPDPIMGHDDHDWVFPYITDVNIDHPSTDSTHLSIGMNFVNYLPGFGRKNTILLSNNTIFRLFRILGLIAVLSYMIVILFTWMYANHQGYVYFSAGEPLTIIKYPEWILGIIGIIATINVLRRELNA